MPVADTIAKKVAGKLAEALRSRVAPMAAVSSEKGAIMPLLEGAASQIPAEQRAIPRLTEMGKEPKLNERSEALLRSKRAAGAVDDLIAKGREINPDLEHWYGTEPLRQFALNEGLSPEEFNRMLAQFSSASQRNPVLKENALGSYLWAVRLFNRFPRKARWLNTGPA